MSSNGRGPLGVPPAEHFGGRHEDTPVSAGPKPGGTYPGADQPNYIYQQVQPIPATPGVRANGLVGGVLLGILKFVFVGMFVIILTVMATFAAIALLASAANRDRDDPAVPDADIVPRDRLSQGQEVEVTNAAARDIVGTASNGKVIVVENGELVIEGPEAPEPVLASPAISPASLAGITHPDAGTSTLSLGLELGR